MTAPSAIHFKLVFSLENSNYTARLPSASQHHGLSVGAKLFLPSLAVVLVLLVLITLIIGQAVYILGPTELLDGFLPKSFVKSPINPKVAIDVYSFGLGLAAFLFFYSPIMLISEYIGTKQAR